MIERDVVVPLLDGRWKNLIRTGAGAALLAGIVFRRNLGVEIGLFDPQNQPGDSSGWFDLLQHNRFIGLAYLGAFDMLNAVLIALLFVALYLALRQAWPQSATIAALLGLMGVTIYLASNTTLSLLALSQQYALTNDAAQRSALLTAGQALLALNRFSSPGAQPGSGGYVSLLLLAVAGLIFSITMWRSRLFGRSAAVTGLLANALDIAYCGAFLFWPASGEMLAVLFIPAAGLFLMVWHVLVGWQLLRVSR